MQASPPPLQVLLAKQLPPRSPSAAPEPPSDGSSPTHALHTRAAGMTTIRTTTGAAFASRIFTRKAYLSEVAARDPFEPFETGTNVLAQASERLRPAKPMMARTASAPSTLPIRPDVLKSSTDVPDSRLPTNPPTN